MHWVMPHMGPCGPASPLPLLLEPASLPLPLALPLLLPAAPLLLVLPLLPLLLPPLVLPLLELPLPLLEPLLPPPELLMPPLPPPLLPPSSPPAVDDVPPHARGVATAVARDKTKTNEIVFILHLLGPRESMELKLGAGAHAISVRSRSATDPVCEMVILSRA
jgi:corin